MTKLLHPRDMEVVEIQTACQKSFQGGGMVGEIDWLNLNRSEGEDCTFPAKVVFSWETDRQESLLELADNEHFSNSRLIHVAGNTAAVGNLLANQRYFWRVNGCAMQSFETEDVSPRWIYVDGLTNVRDMGAWKTADGRRIRQGLIFRGSEMDRHHTVTEDGIRTLRDELNIRCDLDLRIEAVGNITESPMGKDVAFVLIPAKAYGAACEEENKSVYKELFDVLADEKNYPIYYHCWGGADRTGTLALLIEAVLGVSQEDMLLDYELTSLSVWGDRSRKSELFCSLMEALDAYGNQESTLNEKAVAFLKSCGITDDTLNRLRRNLLV